MASSSSDQQSPESTTGPPNKRIKVSQRVENKNSLIASLSKDFNDPELSDVVVRVRGQVFHLHKLVLRQSEVFSVMLSRSWTESTKREITLTEEDICVPHMEAFFRYFYTAEVELTCPRIEPMLILANKYQMQDLQESCECFGKRLLSMPNITHECIVQWLKHAETRNLKILYDACVECVAHNIQYFLRLPQNSCFTLKTLVKILQHPDLIISTDKSKFIQSVIQWAGGDVSKILPELTMVNLRPQELFQIESKTVFSSDNEKYVFQKCLSDAYRFHAMTLAERCDMDLNKVGAQQWIVPNISNDNKLKPLQINPNGANIHAGYINVTKMSEPVNVKRNCCVPFGLSAQEAQQSQNLDVSIKKIDGPTLSIRLDLPHGNKLSNCRVVLTAMFLMPRRIAPELALHFWVNSVFNVEEVIPAHSTKFKNNKRDLSMTLSSEIFKENSPYRIEQSRHLNVFIIGVHVRCYPLAPTSNSSRNT